MMEMMRLRSPGTVPVTVVIAVIIPVVITIRVIVVVVRPSPSPAPIPSHVNVNIGIVIYPIILGIIFCAVVIGLRSGGDVFCGVLVLVFRAGIIINIIIVTHLLRGVATLDGQA